MIHGRLARWLLLVALTPGVRAWAAEAPAPGDGVVAPKGTPVGGAPAAPGQVDARYPFTLEATGLAGLFANLGSYGSSQFVFGGGLTFAGPIAEKRQIAAGIVAATGQSSTGSALYVLGWGGYRILTFADPWRTRFDLDLAADYARYSLTGIQGVSGATHSGFGLGGRAAVSVEYFFFPSLGIGPQADLSVLGITFQVIASLSAVVTLNW